jgi:hypothetical protein
MGPVTALIDVATNSDSIAHAWTISASRLNGIPQNGRANLLSAYLELAGLGAGVHLFAQDLAKTQN